MTPQCRTFQTRVFLTAKYPSQAWLVARFLKALVFRCALFSSRTFPFSKENDTKRFFESDKVKKEGKYIESNVMLCYAYAYAYARTIFYSKRCARKSLLIFHILSFSIPKPHQPSKKHHQLPLELVFLCGVCRSRKLSSVHHQHTLQTKSYKIGKWEYVYVP